jgi:hypothetical protein
MLLRVVHKMVRRSGRVSQREELLDVEQPRIGRAFDSDVQLSALAIELRHSRLERRADGIYLVPSEATEVEVNGRRYPERRLRPRDVIRVSAFELRVLPPGEGEDLCLELSQVVRRQSEREELEKRTQVGLGRGLFTERKLSWLSVFALPLLFIGAPLATKGMFSTPVPTVVIEPKAHGLFESSWDSGPMARVHAFISQDCQRCHAVPFQRVRDSECLQCHGDINAHTPSNLSVAKLDQLRCADCHFEHGGTAGLAALEEQLCSNCHSTLGEHAPKTQVGAVTEFGGAHPEFRLSVPTDALVPAVALGAGTGARSDYTRAVERLERSPELREYSGLRFNHRRHVAQEERTDGSGELLRCNDCHTQDGAGKNMRAMNFEEHCQSCHSIGFDPRYQREALHGDPVLMRQDMLTFYEAKELEALEERVRRGEVLRARVGSEEEREQRTIARQNAQARVRRADEFLMDEEKPGACANCHFVEKGAAPDGGYDVAPVKLLDLWMPRSVFRHETHDPFACRDCHPAAAVYDNALVFELIANPPSSGRAGIRGEPTGLRPRPEWSLPGVDRPYALYTPQELLEKEGLQPSEKAVDILIPGIEKCRGCHGGAAASAPKVASECVLCHPFHRNELGRMRPQTALAR